MIRSINENKENRTKGRMVSDCEVNNKGNYINENKIRATFIGNIMTEKMCIVSYFTFIFRVLIL